MISDLYPILNARLHLNPDNPYVANLTSEKERIGINRVASEMLLYCDGTFTVDEIISKILINYSLKKETEIYNGLTDFFLKSKELGHMSFSTCSRKTKPVVSGSLNYFSPEAIQIELTQQCPLSCKHCYVYAAPDKLDRMSFKLVNDILEQALELGVSNIVLTGGDPMMHPDFWEILEKATSFHNVNLLTSGYLINENSAARLAKYKNLNIQISLDGMEETHNIFRNKQDAFKRTTQAFKYLQNYNKKVVLAMTVSPNNINELEECIVFAKNSGVKKFRPGIIFNTGRAVNQEKSESLFIKKLKQILLDLQIKYNDENFTLEGVEGSSVQDFSSKDQQSYEQTNCGAGWNFCHITAKGEVLACPIFPYELTDIKKESLLNYFSKKDESIRMLQSPKKAICNNCPHLERDSGCPAHGLISSLSNSKCSWVEKLDPIIRDRVIKDVYSPL